MKRLILNIVFLLVFPLAMMAQVVDDSTQNVYGPKTTQYIYEKDILNNEGGYRSIDTTINNQHKWEAVELLNNLYQSLGTVGNALQPIYYQSPDVIGVTSGFNAFDFYFKTPDDFRYFDTKSPYTGLNSVIGGNFRAFLGIDFSRNINENWNAGFNYTRWTIDKQIQPEGRGDINILNNSYDFYTDYQTKNRKYRVLFNIARTFHRAVETGGIDETFETNGPPNYSEFFDYRDENKRLEGISGGELRQRYHIFQQFSFSPNLQLYHRFDWSRQMNEFKEDAPADNNSFFDNSILLSPDSTEDIISHFFIQNELGLKGNFSENFFYRFYSRLKNNRFKNIYLPGLKAINEQYVGGNIRLMINKDWQLKAGAEYEFNGNYKLKADLITPFFNASASSTQFAAPYIYNHFLGNRYFWENDFQSEQVQSISGFFKINLLDRIRLQPGLDLNIVTNHLYFNRESQASQGSGVGTLVHPNIQFMTKFGDFHANGRYIYAIIEGSDADLFRIPEHFLNLNLYYQREIVGNLYGRLGIDANFKSAYRADAYDPNLRQFYLQDEFPLPAQYFGDLYLTFKINNAFLSLKYRHINMPITDGYFTTPYYTGQESVFDIMIRWSFYD